MFQEIFFNFHATPSMHWPLPVVVVTSRNIWKYSKWAGTRRHIFSWRYEPGQVTYVDILPSTARNLIFINGQWSDKLFTLTQANILSSFLRKFINKIFKLWIKFNVGFNKIKLAKLKSIFIFTICTLINRVSVYKRRSSWINQFLKSFAQDTSENSLDSIIFIV